LANYLLAEAADGYRAAFAFPEFDPAFNDRVIILGGLDNSQDSINEIWGKRSTSNERA